MTPTSRGTSGGASGSTWGSKGGDEIVHGNVGNLGHSATEGKVLSAEKRPSRACIAEMRNAGCSCRGSYTQKYYSVASVFEMARLTRRDAREDIEKLRQKRYLYRTTARVRARAVSSERETYLHILSCSPSSAQRSRLLSLSHSLSLSQRREGREGRS